MKKFVSIILAVALVLSLGATAFADYNYKAVNWELSKKGVLTISGYGDMPDYTKKAAPWSKDAGKIKKVIIEDGITHIGAEAFEYCENLTEVVVASTVESFGDYAFYHCKNLKTINFPDILEEIGAYCFDHCAKLKTAVVPDGMDEVPDCAFNCCTSLETIVIHDSVEKIGEGAFNACTSLKTVYYCGSAWDWSEIEIGAYNRSLDTVSVDCAG